MGGEHEITGLFRMMSPVHLIIVFRLAMSGQTKRGVPKSEVSSEPLISFSASSTSLGFSLSHKHTAFKSGELPRCFINQHVSFFIHP